MRVLVVLVVLLALLAGCSGPEVPEAEEGEPRFQLSPWLDGLEQPVWLGAAPGDPARVFIAEQRGIVWVHEEDAVRKQPFLDIRALVGSGGQEQGFLGMAFAPDYQETGAFYVHHSDRGGATNLVRYIADPEAALADPSTRHLVLHVEQPYSNHNGGTVLFGPDGLLYLGLGDGGLAGDPNDHGQDQDTLLGAILRLRVESAVPGYRVPGDNPFANEVYVHGLRNPWRFSFDAATGDLWIGDVGQDHVEEVDRLPAGAIAGANLGWNWKEGSFAYRPTGSPPEGLVDPVAEYDHDGGHCAVTGGHVYRGEAIPALQGAYLFGDYCSGTIWRLTADGEAFVMHKVLETPLAVSSFGEDASGELYVVDRGGSVWKVEPET